MHEECSNLKQPRFDTNRIKFATKFTCIALGIIAGVFGLVAGLTWAAVNYPSVLIDVAVTGVLAAIWALAYYTYKP